MSLARCLWCPWLTVDPRGRTIRGMVKLLTVVAVLYLVQPWQLVTAQEDDQDRQITELRRRVDRHDDMREELATIRERQEGLSGRITRLESLGWGILTVVGAQLLLQGIGLRRPGRN